MPRLTPEQSRKTDRFGIDCPSIMTTAPERLLSGRILDLLDEVAALTARAEQAEEEASEFSRRYEELIFAVAIKHPGETRHETALRYIRQAEGPGSSAALAAKETP